MTSVTRIQGNESPAIEISARSRVAKIDPLIYGGFVEHMGRCIYGGLVAAPEDDRSLIDEHGFRKDVQDCFRELNVPVVRWPGGNFTATYHWMDGIGPVQERPKKMEPAWKSTEPNTFGTDEFMKWCKIVGTEPYIALNMGTGTLDEAMGWLEYLNGTADTYFANLRRKNGHPEPYNVKYFGLGNEMYGPWQVEQNSKEQYAEKVVQWAKALKMIDPTITLVLCGEDGHSDWDRYVLQRALRFVDMHSIHIYTYDREHYANALAPRAAERAIEITSALIDLARTQHDLSKFPEATDTRPKTQYRPTICFDEWNIWCPERAPGEQGAEEKYNVSDMLALAVWLNVFVRQAKHIGMATIAQSINVISPVLTHHTGLVKQTTYWPLYLFSKYMRGHTLAVNVCAPFYEGRTSPAWLKSTVDLPKLDVSAAVDEQGWINLAVANVSDDQDFEVALSAGSEVHVFQVGGREFQTQQINTQESSPVGIRQSKWDGQGKFNFEKLSFTLLRWKGPSVGEVSYGPSHARGNNIVTNALAAGES